MCGAPGLGDVAAQFGLGIANLPEQSGIASEQTAVQQANRELGVAGIDQVAVGGSVDGLADAEVLIPQIPDAERERLLERILGLFVRRQDEQIDIGKRKQLPPSIAAHGHQREIPRHRDPAFRDDPVDQQGSRIQYRCGVARAEKVLADGGVGCGGTTGNRFCHVLLLFVLDCRFAAVAVADTDGFHHLVHKDFAVADLAAARRSGDGVENLVQTLV